jgi:hypothetical protein
VEINVEAFAWASFANLAAALKGMLGKDEPPTLKVSVFLCLSCRLLCVMTRRRRQQICSEDKAKDLWLQKRPTIEEKETY